VEATGQRPGPAQKRNLPAKEGPGPDLAGLRHGSGPTRPPPAPGLFDGCCWAEDPGRVSPAFKTLGARSSTVARDEPTDSRARTPAMPRTLDGHDRQATMEPRAEDALLARARRGDERAFEELVEPLRAPLHARIYRMVASTHDADEVLQETLLRAWRGLPGFEGRCTVRTWLYAIATRACLTELGRRNRRSWPLDLGPSNDPPASEWSTSGSLIDPYPSLDGRSGSSEPEARYELREAVELAFVTACRHLPPRQRAALILRDVMGFSARETAVVLETTVASVTSALQRARATVGTRLPERGRQGALQEPGDPTLQKLVTAYTTAWERADPEAILALLSRSDHRRTPSAAAPARRRPTPSGAADAQRSRPGDLGCQRSPLDA
jgi:RNA polymerase sigma-70 factor, ECF subfamily